MAKRLDELGIPNTLTRNSDITLSPNDRVNRIKKIYGTGNDVLLISNHLNSGGGDGAEIIYALRNSDNLSKKIADNMILSGQNVRKYYQRRLPSNPSKDYYFIIRDTANNESILMEYGFVDSSKDDVNQIKNNYEKLAEAVVKSIAEYFGVKYVEPSKISSDYYIVQKGDTLWSIASKFDLTVSKLKELNNLTDNMITVGQKLFINNNGKSEDIQEKTSTYIVKKGDTLYSIAKLYSTTVDKLKKINNLNSNTLQIGQKLQVPSADKTTVYYVQKGDTLYSISRKFNTTVTEIINLNNLSTSNLAIGQKLLIP